MTQQSLFDLPSVTVSTPADVIVEEPGPLDQIPPPKTDDERILPKPGEPVALADGTQIVVQPFKLREFLRFLRILTRGGAAALDGAAFSATQSPEEFAQQLLALTLFAIPEAEDEVIEFLVTICRPYPLSIDKAIRLEQEASLRLKLENPDLEDTVTLLEIMIRNETQDIRSLGKRLMAMFKVASKMGATKP